MSSSTSISSPPPRRYITTHNSDGKAVFSAAYPTEAPAIDTPSATITTIYTTSQSPAEPAANADLRQYDKHIESPPGVVASGRTAVGLVTLKPGAVAPMHHTVSLDCCVVIKGEFEFELDSGEEKTLLADNTYVQRRTCHNFTNVTPGDGWARPFAVSQEIKPVKVNGQDLKEE